MGLMEINLGRLEEEWCRQPDLFCKWKKKYANISKDVDQAKTDLDVLEADLSLKIKQDPTKYDLPSSVAVTLITSTVKLQRAWKDANKKLMELQHRKGLIGSVVAALEHRKSALERLVQLHGQEYFAKPVARTPEVAAAIDSIKSQRARKKAQRNTQKGRRK